MRSVAVRVRACMYARELCVPPQSWPPNLPFAPDSPAAPAPGLRAFDSAVSAVGPDKLVRDAVSVTHAGGQAVLHIAQRESMPVPMGVRMLAFGKASIPMARAAERQLGSALSKGIVIAQPSAESAPENCGDFKSEILTGSPGNLPDAAAVTAARRALALAQGAQDGEVLLVLISGGGSALLPLPAPPLTLDDKLGSIKLMQAAGCVVFCAAA